MTEILQNFNRLQANPNGIASQHTMLFVKRMSSMSSSGAPLLSKIQHRITASFSTTVAGNSPYPSCASPTYSSDGLLSATDKFSIKNSFIEGRAVYLDMQVPSTKISFQLCVFDSSTCVSRIVCGCVQSTTPMDPRVLDAMMPFLNEG